MQTWFDIMALILMAIFTVSAVAVFSSAVYFFVRDLREEWQYNKRKRRRNEGKQERN